MTHPVKETQELVDLVISWETDKVKLENPTGSNPVITNSGGAGSLSAAPAIVREALPHLKNLKIEVVNAQQL